MAQKAAPHTPWNFKPVRFRNLLKWIKNYAFDRLSAPNDGFAARFYRGSIPERRVASMLI
jgi:hypothetical protein